MKSIFSTNRWHYSTWSLWRLRLFSSRYHHNNHSHQKVKTIKKQKIIITDMLYTLTYSAITLNIALFSPVHSSYFRLAESTVIFQTASDLISPESVVVKKIKKKHSKNKHWAYKAVSEWVDSWAISLFLENSQVLSQISIEIYIEFGYFQKEQSKKYCSC